MHHHGHLWTTELKAGVTRGWMNRVEPGGLRWSGVAWCSVPEERREARGCGTEQDRTEQQQQDKLIGTRLNLGQARSVKVVR